MKKNFNVCSITLWEGFFIGIVIFFVVTASFSDGSVLLLTFGLVILGPFGCRYSTDHFDVRKLKSEIVGNKLQKSFSSKRVSRRRKQVSTFIDCFGKISPTFFQKTPLLKVDFLSGVAKNATIGHTCQYRPVPSFKGPSGRFGQQWRL